MTVHPNQLLAERISEAVFQERILELCRVLRLTWHHETDSRRTRKGFPDLVIVGPRGVIFTELKKQTGRVTPEQQEWLDAVNAADGGEAHLWRPSDWLDIQRRLFRLAGRPLPRDLREDG